jgi:hypothetical protein
MLTRRQFVLGVSLTALGVSACGGSSRKPTFPVTGKLLWDGKPIPNASVVFHPVKEDTPEPLRPRGKTKEDGSFTLTTYDTDDGAPAGEYRLSVELWLGGRPDEGPSNRLPPQLGNPETSRLTATVAASPNDLKPIDLRRQ